MQPPSSSSRTAAVVIVDLYASRRHYLEHLAPVWLELDEGERGTVHVPEHLEPAAITLLGAVHRRETTGSVRLAAGWVDVQGPPNTQRKVLMEHGVGQRYEQVSSPHYVGGRGREEIDLVLLPNHVAARYETVENVVVGDPFLDRLRTIELAPLWDVTFTFHFQTDLCPEASGYSSWFFPGVVDCVDHGLNVLGHGHPAAIPALTVRYAEHGVTRTSELSTSLMTRCFAADNTSAMFYAAALDVPVIVLNPPYYRRSVEHGLRFWEFADVGLNVSAPGDVRRAVLDALDDPERFSARRSEVSAQLFPFDDGMCAKRCVDALRGMFKR